MPQFSYKARRRTGEVVEGMLEVADRSAALVQIERLGLFPVAVDAAKGARSPPLLPPNGRPGARRIGARCCRPRCGRRMSQKRKPKLQELATFTQQLANLLSSGMPLTVALNSMTHLESKGISADVSKELKQDVMEGRSLSDAMAKQPRIFSDLYVNMVRAGESSGALVEVLRRMADHFERFAAGAVQVHLGAGLSGLRVGGGHWHHVLLHDLHAAEVHDHLRGHERAPADDDADPDRASAISSRVTGG